MCTDFRVSDIELHQFSCITTDIQSISFTVVVPSTISNAFYQFAVIICGFEVLLGFGWVV